MSEQQVHRPQPSALGNRQTIARPGDDSGEGGADTSGSVQVIFGAIMDDLEVVGMTVAQARAELEGPYNIAPEASVNINGAEVDADTRLSAGDVLEFVRAAGEKGARGATR